MNLTSLESFTYRHENLPITYKETTHVTDGVECYVYAIDNDPHKDLALIVMQPGSSTFIQQFVKGDKTIEGHVSGDGELTVIRADGEQQLYTFKDGTCYLNGEEIPKVRIMVHQNELMWWRATGDKPLVFFEVCYPPFEPGRFEDIARFVDG